MNSPVKPLGPDEKGVGDETGFGATKVDSFLNSSVNLPVPD